MTEDAFSLNHHDERRHDLHQLKGRTVQQAIVQLSGQDYITEICLFVTGGQWAAHPVGGPWAWLDTPPIAYDLNPLTALAQLLAMPALPQEN